MVTITFTAAEAKRIKQLVHADFHCNDRVAKTYTCTPAEKKKYEKSAKLAKALEKKLEAFGL